MRVVHLLFDEYPFIDSWGYQENKMCNAELKYEDVAVISSIYKAKVLSEHVDFGEIKDYEETERDGHRLFVYRLKCLFGNTFFGTKLKYYKGLYKVLCRINPEIVFVHDLHASSLITLNRFLKKNPNIKCIADIHINYLNSASNVLSKVMHRFFYGPIIRNNISNVEKIYYLHQNGKRFVKEMYGIDEHNKPFELLPLGGELVPISKKEEAHNQFCDTNNIPRDSIVFVHSGKLNRAKKTITLLKTFNKLSLDNAYLIVVGKPEKEIEEEFNTLIFNSNNTIFLGWKTNTELMDILLAADCYLQPGTPSVTAHEALCKGCATMISDAGGFYHEFIDGDSVFYAETDDEIAKFISAMALNIDELNKYKKRGYNLACEIFDYSNQVKRVL